MRVYFERRRVIIVLVVAAAVLVPVAVWQAQSLQMRAEFVTEMKAGRVTQFPPYLTDKVWTDRDLGTAKVQKIVHSSGRQRALSAAAYNLGQDRLPSSNYSYQASVTDTTTGMKYWFGRMRNQPGSWAWAGIHPDSVDRWIQQRGEEATALQGKRAPQ